MAASCRPTTRASVAITATSPPVAPSGAGRGSGGDSGGSPASRRSACSRGDVPRDRRDAAVAHVARAEEQPGHPGLRQDTRLVHVVEAGDHMGRRRPQLSSRPVEHGTQLRGPGRRHGGQGRRGDRESQRRKRERQGSAGEACGCDDGRGVEQEKGCLRQRPASDQGRVAPLQRDGDEQHAEHREERREPGCRPTPCARPKSRGQEPTSCANLAHARRAAQSRLPSG